MENREEKIIELISELKDAFYDTPDKFFVVLVKMLIEYDFSDDEITKIVNKTISNVSKTRLTVADVLNNAAKSNYEFMMNGKRCYGDKNNFVVLPKNAPPRPSNQHFYNASGNNWTIL